jgi:NADPH2:quinone reductase
MVKRQTITGSTLRASPCERKAEIARALREKVWPLLAQRKVRTVIHATFPLAQAAQAHALMESSRHIGKIVLAVKEAASS